MHWLDACVLALYAGAVLCLGWWTGRNERDENDYFLGGRAMPWLAVAVSIYATSASALTFIGVPGAAFAGDFRYLQLAVGDFVGRGLIAYFLISAYYKAEVSTVYQLLGKRFGPRSQDAGIAFFLVTRVLASAVRLAGCAIAFAVIFEMPLDRTILVVAAIAVLYTTAGGIRAVIWTDFLQFLLFVGGAFFVIGVIWNALPGGFGQFLEVGGAAGKFKVFHFTTDWNDSTNFLSGSLFGLFLTFAVLGTDQDLVQRMLTTKTARESQRALMLTAVLNAPMTLLFLTVGASLFVFYQVAPDPGAAELIAKKRFDYVFPFFIKTVLAPGLRGILMAGLLAAAMSSLDSALNALSSTAYLDLYKKYWRSDAGPREAVRISRALSVGFGLLLALVAIGFGHRESILWFGFRIMGYTYGALLGVFLLAVWTERRGADAGNIVAMATSVALVVFLTAEAPLGIAAVAWPWSIVIGTAWTFAVAALWKTPEGRSL